MYKLHSYGDVKNTKEKKNHRNPEQFTVVARVRPKFRNGTSVLNTFAYRCAVYAVYYKIEFENPIGVYCTQGGSGKR